jgi:hypothetical protein
MEDTNVIDNVFEKACLIQLSCSIWQGSRMIDHAVMERLGKNSDWIKGRKFLINPELLGPVKTAVHQARNTIQKFALPFPISSIYLVPKESLVTIDGALHRYQERFWEKVSGFEEVYATAMDEAKGFLGDLFNQTDYPDNIQSKFKFEWRFLTLNVPEHTSILSPEVYAREKEKFLIMMDEAREMASITLADELGKIVSILTEKLTSGDKPRTLGNTMFNKLNEFLDGFDKRNLFNDETLIELTNQARSIIGGVSPVGIIYNNEMRKKISKDMTAFRNSIELAIEDLPRRKLQLAA